MIVLDASVVVDGLISPSSPSGRCLQRDDIQVPELAEQDVLSGLRSAQLGGILSPEEADLCHSAWARLRLARHGTTELRSRVWALRHSLTIHDATYVALAESLRCGLCTRDARMAAASGVRCDIEHVA